MSNTVRINDHLELLGKKVRERVTGTEGVVTTIGFDLYGCIQATVTQQGIKEDGKLKEQYWFDVNRLEVLDEKPVMKRPQFEWHATPQYVAEGRSGAAEKPAR